MTGLAALRLGRKAQLSDISVLGRHIAKGYSTSVDPNDFRAAADAVVNRAHAAVRDLYATRRLNEDTADNRPERFGLRNY